jgi:hypothetical protein
MKRDDSGDRYRQFFQNIFSKNAARRGLSFPKTPSGQIRAMRQNQRIIRSDACDPSSARDVCR